MGAAYGTAKSGTGIAAMAVMRPEAIMKSIIPVSSICNFNWYHYQWLLKTDSEKVSKYVWFLNANVFQVVMAGIIAIYGGVVAVLIAGQLAPAGVGSDYTLYKWGLKN